MVEDEKRKPLERDTTDESLRTERRKTDAELNGSIGAIKEDADEVVAQARQKADSLLSDARDREDRKVAAAGSSPDETRGLGRARAKEDAVLTAERSSSDAAATDERARRQAVLASLLAFERQDTDLRLQIERSRADEALSSREEFFAIVSHDLRTLLSGVEMSAELLKKVAKTEEPADEVERYADRILRISARMNRLIGDLIDVASIEASKLSMVPEQNDVALLVRDSIEAFAPAAAAHGVEIKCVIGAGLQHVELDHGRILQVLTNLIGNALKFTGKGGLVEVRVEARVEARGSEVLFAVADTGQGIPADRLDTIFDRFFQMNRNDRRGLGLGLYIARSIVDAHGGKIWAESKPGEGSTFFFTLPARAVKTPSAATS